MRRGSPAQSPPPPAAAGKARHVASAPPTVRAATLTMGACASRPGVTTPAERCCRSPSTRTSAGPTSVRDIAERTGLPQPYLEQILLALKGAGLVRSKRGVGGGYVLARPPADIRLSEIVSAVDGPITLGDFGEPHQDGACDHEGQCVLLAIWNRPASRCAATSTASPSPIAWPTMARGEPPGRPRLGASPTVVGQRRHPTRLAPDSTPL